MLGLEDSSEKGAKLGAAHLTGTTLKVYRFLYRQGRPIGVHDVQRGLKMQSASSAHYHLRKLVDLELVRETESGYEVDRVLFENMIRIGRSLIPIQATFAAFFLTTLLIFVTLLRPTVLYGAYFFALIVNSAAFAVFAYQTYRGLKRSL